MDKQTPLTQAEWKIMCLLWQKHPQTMPELVQALAPETGWTKNTVITLLKRMQAKGTVLIDESGAIKRYSPAVDKDKVAREQTQTLLDRMFDGKASQMVSNMVEQGEISGDEMREIMALLQKASENGKK